MWERRCPGPSSVLSFLRSLLCSHVGEEVSRAILSAIVLTFSPLQSCGRGGVPGHPQCYHSYVLSFAVMWERRCPGPSSVLSFLRSLLCSHVGEEVSRAILSAIILAFFPLQSCGRGGVPGHPQCYHSCGLSFAVMWERRCPGPSSLLSFLRSFLCSHVGEEVARAILSAIILTFFPLQSCGRGGVPGHPHCYHSYVHSFAVMWERRCPGPSSVLSFLRSFLCSHVGEEVSRAILTALIPMGSQVLSPTSEGIGFAELMLVMETLAEAGSGSGHAALFQAAMGWLELWWVCTPLVGRMQTKTATKI